MWERANVFDQPPGDNNKRGTMDFSVESLETPALTKAQLADLLFEQIGLNKRESKDMIDAFFDLIAASLVDGTDVKISGFGNFQIRVIDLQHLYAVEHDLAVALLVTLTLQQFLHLVARAADRKTLVVQQIADAPDHQHLVVLVVAAVATPLHGPQLRELLLPIP